MTAAKKPTAKKTSPKNSNESQAAELLAPEPEQLPDAEDRHSEGPEHISRRRLRCERIGISDALHALRRDALDVACLR